MLGSLFLKEVTAQLARSNFQNYCTNQYDITESEFRMIQMCTKRNFLFHHCSHLAPAYSGSISADGR